MNEEHKNQLAKAVQPAKPIIVSPEELQQFNQAMEKADDVRIERLRTGTTNRQDLLLTCSAAEVGALVSFLAKCCHAGDEPMDLKVHVVDGDVCGIFLDQAEYEPAYTFLLGLRTKA